MFLVNDRRTTHNRCVPDFCTIEPLIRVCEPAAHLARACELVYPAIDVLHLTRFVCKSRSKQRHPNPSTCALNWLQRAGAGVF